MTWHDLLRTRRIQRHSTSKQELDALRAVVERDLKDGTAGEGCRVQNVHRGLDRDESPAPYVAPRPLHSPAASAMISSALY